ncbi:membrane protein of unknown function [Caballeronia sp. S22]
MNQQTYGARDTQGAAPPNGETSAPKAAPSKAMIRRIVFSSSIGNALEWFDFLVYGYFATVIAKAFFPSNDEWLSTMLAIGTFGISFLMRPLGAIVLGVYGDRKGRKAALTLAILLMMVGTFTMAVMPSYQHIGVAAPLLILLARLVQGFAVGGEFGSATAFMVEHKRSAARLLRELAVREPGARRDHGCGVRLGSERLAAAAATRKLGLAHSFRLRTARRAGRLLHPLAPGRNAGVSRDAFRKEGQRPGRLVLEPMAEPAARRGHRGAIDSRRVCVAALYADVRGQAAASSGDGIVRRRGAQWRTSVHFFAVDGRALRSARAHPHHARHVDLHGRNDLSDVCVAAGASDDCIARHAAIGSGHSEGRVFRSNARAHVRDLPDAGALDRPVDRLCARCHAIRRIRADNRRSVHPRHRRQARAKLLRVAGRCIVGRVAGDRRLAHARGASISGVIEANAVA